MFMDRFLSTLIGNSHHWILQFVRFQGYNDNDNINNSNDDDERISRAPFHVKHAQLS